MKTQPPIQMGSVNNNSITAALKSDACDLYLLLWEMAKYPTNKNTIHKVFIYCPKIKLLLAFNEAYL